MTEELGRYSQVSLKQHQPGDWLSRLLVLIRSYRLLLKKHKLGLPERAAGELPHCHDLLLASTYTLGFFAKSKQGAGRKQAAWWQTPSRLK